MRDGSSSACLGLRRIGSLERMCSRKQRLAQTCHCVNASPGLNGSLSVNPTLCPAGCCLLYGYGFRRPRLLVDNGVFSICCLSDAISYTATALGLRWSRSSNDICSASGKARGMDNDTARKWTAIFQKGDGRTTGTGHDESQHPISQSRHLAGPRKGPERPARSCLG